MDVIGGLDASGLQMNKNLISTKTWQGTTSPVGTISPESGGVGFRKWRNASPQSGHCAMPYEQCILQALNVVNGVAKMAAIPFSFPRLFEFGVARGRDPRPAGEPGFLSSAGAARRLAADAANGKPLQDGELAILFCRKDDQSGR